LEALDHSDPFVRMWAVRLLGDENRVTPGIASRLAALARSEPNIEVRNQLACSARRLPSKECLQIVQQLVTQKRDADDSRQPLLIWWALEAKVGAHPDEVLALFESASLWREPLVEKHLLSRLMRRFAQAGTRHDLLACARIFDLSPSADHTQILTDGFAAAFKGRPMTGFPEELVAAMERHHVDSVAVRLRQLGADAVDTALQTIANENASPETRIEALSILSEVSLPKSVPVVLRVVKSARDGAVRTAAIRALQLHDDQGIARALLEQFHSFDAEAQSAALAVLSGRASFALDLAKTVKAGSIKAEVIPPSVVRKMRLHKNDELRQLAAQLWPNVGGASVAVLEKRIAEVAVALREGTGDPWSGQPLFDQRCGVCHALFGRGGQIGPDLTAFERSNLQNMLLNIVNPNAEIREGYENYLVTTKSGRLLSGFLVERDDRMSVIRGPDGQNTSITADDLEEMKPAGMSLMPEGLLDGLNPQQLRDLFAYLRSTQPLVPKPAR
jgi:putative heme-binding domain-containing protein